jgi:dCMP deaminase
MISKKERYDWLYLDIAQRVAKMSHARRLQVGSVLVKDDRILSYGWNGMPIGWDNNCEDLVTEAPLRYPPVQPFLVTRPEVLHAESNCLSKVARSTESSEGGTMYITHSPCMDCAKLIHQAGIERIIYLNLYRSTIGLDFLKKCGMEVEKYDSNNCNK